MRVSRIAELCFALFLLSVVYLEVTDFLRVPQPADTTELITLIFFLFAFTHAWSALGAGRTIVFLLIVYFVTFAFELLGVSTGIPFGAYYYTDQLGYKILGSVPVLIPVAWFMMIYSSRAVALTLLGKSDFDSRVLVGSRLDILLMSLLGAAAMTAWDLIMDPMMVAYGYWVWTNPGAYFGIPLTNFLGWFLVSFLIFLLFEVTQKQVSGGRPGSGGVLYSFLPIGAYIITWLETTANNLRLGQDVVAGVGFFTMGLVAMISSIAYFSAASWQTTRLPGVEWPASRVKRSLGHRRERS